MNDSDREGVRDSAMADAFRALADPNRRALLDRLEQRNGQTLRELCAGLAMARQSVSKHLAVLEAAHLVTTARRGREKLHFLNAAPINAIAERWINRYDRQRAEALADLTTALERRTMSTDTPTADTPTAANDTDTTNDFVYTTYIKTTAEQLWQAITEPAFTQRYWGVTLRSDWTVGALVTWEYAGATMADAEQIVLESDPPRRLSFRWHAITPEFADAINASEDEIAPMRAEPLSHITFDIEPMGDLVKLTVIHGGFRPGSAVRAGVSQGWPTILASLKTLLETGEPLTFA